MVLQGLLVQASSISAKMACWGPYTRASDGTLPKRTASNSTPRATQSYRKQDASMLRRNLSVLNPKTSTTELPYIPRNSRTWPLPMNALLLTEVLGIASWSLSTERLGFPQTLSQNWTRTQSLQIQSQNSSDLMNLQLRNSTLR